MQDRLLCSQSQVAQSWHRLLLSWLSLLEHTGTNVRGRHFTGIPFVFFFILLLFASKPPISTHSQNQVR